VHIFHLAIEGGDLETTLPFYTELLERELGPFEPGLWQDIDFWENELTLHQTVPRRHKDPDRKRHEVDMGAVCVPHFGIHLSMSQWAYFKNKIEKEYGFLDEPIIRFEGTDRQQATFFIEDPNFNVIEIKSVQGTYYFK